jgi:hypothetical protein
LKAGDGNSVTEMSDSGKNTNTSGWLQRIGVGITLTISSIAIISIVLMVNYLSARHFKRFDITASKQWSLSPLTKNVLKNITNDVKVVVYMDKENPVYDLTVLLLREYAAYSPSIKPEIVNPTSNPGEAEKIKALYKLGNTGTKDLVIFECNEQKKIIYASELSDFELEPLESGNSREFRRRLVGFKGESLFTSALIWVLNPRTLKAYFVQDHGEHNPFNKDEIVGFSRFTGLLEANRISVEQISLFGSGEIPPDCGLLICAAPREPYTTDEIEKIERYLNQGGRMLILLNNNSVGKVTGLEKLLIGWGVVVGDNIVLDPTRQVPGSRGLALSLNVFGAHPIVEPLIGGSIHVLMPRSVSAIKTNSKQPDAPKVTELVFTSEQGVAANEIRDGTVYFNPGRIIRGNYPIAVAVEKGSVRGVAAGRGSTRIVVVGDSFFIANQLIETANNRDFAQMAINWLADRSEVITGIGPRAVKEYRLLFTQKQMNTLRALLLAVFPGTILFIGLIVWLRRRK